MSVFNLLKRKVNSAGKQYKIVFPEGNDLRVLKAASRLSEEEVVKPVLLGNVAEVKNIISAAHLTFDQLSIIDVNNYPRIEELVEQFIQIRGKEVSADQARQALSNPNYFATMLVQTGEVDGMVSGAAHSTAATVRPALQLIRTAANMNRVSGSFIMERGEEKYIFADCAININPDSETLAEIAFQSVQTAKMIDIDPKVAFLSFSTKGSAKGEMVDKVMQGASLFSKQHPEIASDGELQFDAAFVPSVAHDKAPDSAIKGRANIFIFPELQSGNIAYKIAQRLAGFSAIGPILQGLKKPVNDLSRGATSQDVYNIAILTAMQALLREENEA